MATQRQIVRKVIRWDDLTPADVAKIPANFNYSYQVRVHPELGFPIQFGKTKPNGDQIETFFYAIEWDVDANTGELVEPRYSNIEQVEGKIKDDGHGSPSQVMIVWKRGADGERWIYVNEENRPVIFNHLTHQKGVVIAHSIGGGYNDKGLKPEENAILEVAHEQGLHVKRATVHLMGISSWNRGKDESCIEYYEAQLDFEGEQSLEGDEILGKTHTIRWDEFQPAEDGIPVTAWGWFVRDILNEKKLETALVALPREAKSSLLAAYNGILKSK